MGRDIGDAALLRSDYESPRMAANGHMMAALDGLQRVFGLQAGPAGALRAAGLGAVNAAGPLRDALMRYAMGVPAA